MSIQNQELNAYIQTHSDIPNKIRRIDTSLSEIDRLQSLLEICQPLSYVYTLAFQKEDDDLQNAAVELPWFAFVSWLHEKLEDYAEALEDAGLLLEQGGVDPRLAELVESIPPEKVQRAREKVQRLKRNNYDEIQQKGIPLLIRENLNYILSCASPEWDIAQNAEFTRLCNIVKNLFPIDD